MKKASLILFLLFSAVKICFSQDTFNSLLLKVKEMELPFSTNVYKKDILDLKNKVVLTDVQAMKYILKSNNKNQLEYTVNVFDPDKDAYIGKVTDKYQFCFYRKKSINSSNLIIYSKIGEQNDGYYLALLDKNGIMRDQISIYKIFTPSTRFDTIIKSKISSEYKVKQFIYTSISSKENKNTNSKYFNKNSLVIIKTYEILDRESKFKLIKQDTILSIYTKSKFLNYDKSAEKFDPFNE
jgi:hypothetical protein